MNASEHFAVDLTWDESWPLYVVFPLSVLFFAGFYLVGPTLWPQTPVAKEYARFSELNKKCWRQNCCAMVHSVVVTVMLVVCFATDPELRNERPLHPHHNLIGYTALSFSLGYFSFAIPWTYHLYFCKGERHATNFALVVHHAVVWVGALTYLLGRTCGLYGAVAFACMEFTNWFFILHIILQMLRSKRKRLRDLNYLTLLVAFATCRLGICTWMGVLFTEDLSHFTSDSIGEWTLVIIQYAIFAFVWALSWYFVYAELKPILKPLVTQKVEERVSQWKSTQAKKAALKSVAKSTSTDPSIASATSSSKKGSQKEISSKKQESQPTVGGVTSENV